MKSLFFSLPLFKMAQYITVHKDTLFFLIANQSIQFFSIMPASAHTQKGQEPGKNTPHPTGRLFSMGSGRKGTESNFVSLPTTPHLSPGTAGFLWGSCTSPQLHTGVGDGVSLILPTHSTLNNDLHFTTFCTIILNASADRDAEQLSANGQQSFPAPQASAGGGISSQLKHLPHAPSRKPHSWDSHSEIPDSGHSPSPTPPRKSSQDPQWPGPIPAAPTAVAAIFGRSHS